MSEPNDIYTRIQSIRIKNVEDQVHLLRRELQRLREGILHKNDVAKLTKLMERLKELNLILIELKNYYNCMQQQSMFQGKRNNARHKTKQKSATERLESDSKFKVFHRENAGLDRNSSSCAETSKENQLSKQITSEPANIEKDGNLKEPFKTCKQLLLETKSPSSILGNYLVRLQDFRADPELKRKRWEQKQQEKLQQLEKRKNLVNLSEDKTAASEESQQTTANKPENTVSSRYTEGASEFTIDNLPIIENNLTKIIDEIISDIDRKAIALAIVLENDHVYHVNVFSISQGYSLSCFLATDAAIEEAKLHHLFQDLFTFFVVNAKTSDVQKNRLLGHLFEFF